MITFDFFAHRFFEANPDYIKFFPFGELDSVEEVLKDPRLKLHAGRVMSALSSIVDNLNNPSNFEQQLREIISTHAERKIELNQFLNLKQALVQFLIDKLGPDVMNEEAMSAWSKAYSVILNAYEHRN